MASMLAGRHAPKCVTPNTNQTQNKTKQWRCPTRKWRCCLQPQTSISTTRLQNLLLILYSSKLCRRYFLLSQFRPLLAVSIALLTHFKMLSSLLSDTYMTYTSAVSLPSTFRSTLPTLCTIWFMLEVDARIISIPTSGTSKPISSVWTESRG